MGLIYYETVPVGFDSFLAEIEEKTGVVIDGTTIKFPDMEEAVDVGYMPTSYSTTLPFMVFADVKNHFLMIVRIDSSIYNTSNTTSNWLCCFVYENNGVLVQVQTGASFMTLNIFNIGRCPNNNGNNSFVIAPLFVNPSTTVNSPKNGLVKNAYVNYDQVFTPGCRFIDKNGNEFVSLGNYFLYLDEKEED